MDKLLCEDDVTEQKYISGQEFNQLTKGKIFVKILAIDLIHRGFTYAQGLNIDTVKFNPTGSCRAGGLYFSDIENIDGYFSYGSKYSFVCIPDDARVYTEDKKYKADKIYLEDIQCVEYSHSEIYAAAFKKNKDKNIISYIPHWQRAAKLVQSLLETDNSIMKHLPFHDINLYTTELCEIAMKNNPDNFKYIPDKLKTQKMADDAVGANYNMIKFVSKHMKTEQMCNIVATNVCNDYAQKLINFKQAYDILTYIPHKLKTYKMCDMILSKLVEKKIYQNNKIFVDCVPRLIREEFIANKKVLCY